MELVSFCDIFPCYLIYVYIYLHTYRFLSLCGSLQIVEIIILKIFWTIPDKCMTKWAKNTKILQF